MANINDYLLWRGDIPISKAFPFNEVDSMILARFSYLRFDKIQMQEEETISTISKKMQSLEEEEFLYHGDKDLITNLGNSPRFQNMLISDYIKINDRETEKQFGAITIHISEKELYVSYLGTDSTLYGWKEDFNMAFMESVPCQENGREYLEKIASCFPKKKLRIGGHSKGGNVAIYSALTASKKVQNRIIKVYNYDGPGFSKTMTQKYENSSILAKVVTYFPQDSMIGRIMYHKEACQIAFSIEKNVYQHDIYSWQVLKDDLIYSDALTDASEVMNGAVTEWLEATTNEQRKAFFDGVFEIFYATDANTFSEISTHKSANIMTMLKTYQGINAEDKKRINEMLKLFAKSYFSIMKQKETHKIDVKREQHQLENKQKLEIFDEKYFGKLKRKKQP